MTPPASLRLGLIWPLLLSPSLALAQTASTQTPPAPGSGFESLWTGWSSANRESIRAEEQAARSAQPAGPAAGSRSYQAGSVALGERVGEVVRLGDCTEGERLAREAGDFPLVDAVRTHCRPRPQQAR